MIVLGHLLKTTNFINLALIKDQTSWRRTVQESVHEIVGKIVATSYHIMFNNLEDCRFILLEGRPGSGKTTLMNKISRDWASGDILASKLLIFIPLQRLNAESDRKLTTILRVACPTLPKVDIKYLASDIEQSQGEGVVFAFDGLDEYIPRRKRWRFKSRHRGESKVDGVFQKLYGKSLTKALIVVTSRPSACREFCEHTGKRMEVLGFCEPQVIEYICHYFDSDRHKAQQIIAHLEQHSNLMNMAYLPLHCAMLVFLYEEDTVLPETKLSSTNISHSPHSYIRFVKDKV